MSDKFTCLNLCDNSIVQRMLETIETTDVKDNILSVLESFKHQNSDIQSATSEQRESIANEILEYGLGYFFDAAYCDKNNIPFCENCTYEWGNHFWSAITTYVFALGKSQEFHVFCEEGFIHIALSDGHIKVYAVDTSSQQCSVNETVKRLIEVDMTEAA